MSKSIVEFLQSNKSLKQNDLGGAFSIYWTNVFSEKLKAEIAEAKYDHAIKSGITQREEKTQQNALHYALSNQLYAGTDESKIVITEEILNRYSNDIQQIRKQIENSSKIQARYNETDASKFAWINKGAPEFRSDYYGTYHYGYQNRVYKKINECYECSGCKERNQKIAECQSLEDKLSTELKASNNEVTKLQNALREKFQKEIKQLDEWLTIKDFKLKHLPKIIAEIIAPFEKDDDGLMGLLQAKDGKRNTPLHTGLIELVSADFLPVFDRIKKLPPTYIASLMEMTNGDYQTMLHIAMNRWTNPFQSFRETFGDDNIRKILHKPDSKENTVLHEALLTGSGLVTKINILTEIMKPKPKPDQKDVKDTPLLLEHIYRQNKEGKNPLHLAALVKLQDDKEELTVLRQVKEVLPTNLLSKKQKEQDRSGNLALHYAIQSGKRDKVNELLKGATKEEKQFLMQVANKSKETPLHYILKFGDRLMLEDAIKEMGVEIFFNLREKYNKDFEKIVSGNNALKNDYPDLVKQYNLLFEAYNYFRKKHGGGVYLTSNYEARINDFKSCLEKRSKNQPIAVDENQFLKGKTHGYQDYRDNLHQVTPEQATEFLAYLKKQQSCEVAQLLLGAREFGKLNSKKISSNTTASTQCSSAMFYGNRQSGIVVEGVNDDVECVLVTVSKEGTPSPSAPAK